MEGAAGACNLNTCVVDRFVCMSPLPFWLKGQRQSRLVLFPPTHSYQRDNVPLLGCALHQRSSCMQQFPCADSLGGDFLWKGLFLKPCLQSHKTSVKTFSGQPGSSDSAAAITIKTSEVRAVGGHASLLAPPSCKGFARAAAPPAGDFLEVLCMGSWAPQTGLGSSAFGACPPVRCCPGLGRAFHACRDVVLPWASRVRGLAY